MSAADKARHYRLGHGGKRGIERKETTNDKTPRLTLTYVLSHLLPGGG